MKRRAPIAAETLVAAAALTGLASLAAAQCGWDTHRCFDIGGPGCNNSECCELVCASVPYCCETVWDSLCVNVATALCPVGGWVASSSTGHLYFELGPFADWATQHERSLALGGHLVSIGTSSENNLVRNLSLFAFGSPVLIGLSDFAQEGTFAWVDGTPITYTNWAAGQPDDLPAGADVAELHATDAKWRDAPATWMRFAFAEVDALCGEPGAGDCFATHIGHSCAWRSCCGTVCMTDPVCCSADWDQACVDAATTLCQGELAGSLLVHYETGHVYGVVFAPYQIARDVAHALGGELIVINTASEDAFASDTVVWWCTGKLLTGLNDLETEGVFKWIDGTPVTFTNWLPGQPDNLGSAGTGEADVMAVDFSAGQWHDESALFAIGTIVEFEARCGLPLAGSCFKVNADGSCNDAECCADVCLQSMDCCLVTWDASCVELANYWCLPNTDPCANNDDCFEAHPSPGCEIAACCTAVCAIDPTCCATTWDAGCASSAQALCAGCGTSLAGSCFVDHPATGCDDATCCSFICSFLFECCFQSWDYDCADAAGLTCQPIPVIGPVRNPKNGHDYLVLSRGSWTAAEAKAVALGGHLVAIADESEWAFVVELMAPLMHDPFGDGFWIGLTDASSPGQFTWTTGEPVTFTAFAGHEPSGGPGEDYVQYLYNPAPAPAVWNDVPNQGIGVFTLPIPEHVPFAVVEVVPAPRCIADLDASGAVDGADLSVLLASWGRAGGAADLDESGSVGGADLAILLAEWGACR